ncbi:MAG: O-antigen ligase family protein [Flavobacteriaceae bacterium]
MLLLDKKAIIFIVFVIIFVLDSVLNYFYNIPLFVISLMFYFALLMMPGFLPYKNYRSLLIIVLCFSISFIFNSIRSGFYKESLSDFLFIISFFGSFYLYSNKFAPNNKVVTIFLIASLIMFLATFIGFDQNIWGNTMGLKTKDIEFSRSYRQGFFRKAHIAAYFFTIIILYLFNRYKELKKNRFNYIVIILPLIIIVLLTGSRTPIAVVLIGVLLYYMKVKHLKYLLILALITILSIVYIDALLILFSDTIIYQYLSIVKTVTSNFDRLSRVIIWSSWWTEIKTFNLIDIIFGRGFNSSLEANSKNISNHIWFHNDFFSIIYSYGILPLVLYVSLFINMYKKHKKAIKHNLFIFLSFSSFWLSAFFNGFYYYFTVILLYLFYSMIYEKNEVSNFRD